MLGSFSREPFYQAFFADGRGPSDSYRVQDARITLLSSSRIEQHTSLVLVGVAKIVDFFLFNEAFSANCTKFRCIKDHYSAWQKEYNLIESRPE